MEEKNQSHKDLASSFLEMRSFEQVQPDEQELKAPDDIDIGTS